MFKVTTTDHNDQTFTQNVSNVTNMNRMFSYCLYFDQLLNNWDVSKVTSMSSMFSYCLYF